MKNMSSSLKAQMNKHPTLTYKEVFYNERFLVLFYDVDKDEAGYEYFDDFFVTDLQGAQINNLTDREYEELKRLV